MLPDEKIGCHRTGFQMTCYDGVTKHKCQLWCHVAGTDAMGNAVEAFGCADVLGIKFQHEIAKEVRQAAASTDKVATEVRNGAESAAARDVYLINGLKATLPMLHHSLRAQIEDRSDDHVPSSIER